MRREDGGSASIRGEVRFASDADRRDFFNEYTALVDQLVARYASKTGAPFRVVTAVHPEQEET